MKKKITQKVDIIVEARMTSTRLPGKVLMEAAGKPLLELMIERLKKISQIDDVIIATTTNRNDNKIEDLANKMQVKCFRGSEDDVLKRVLLAALEFKTDVIVEITGDNPLIDKTISEKVIDFFLKNQKDYDYVSNDANIHDDIYNISCSLGFNTKVFKTKLLAEIDKKTNHPIDREHVVNYVFNKNENYRIYNFEGSKEINRPDIRLTLDYLEDYKVIKSIFDSLYSNNNYFSALDIMTFLDNNPQIKALNSNCTQNRYKY